MVNTVKLLNVSSSCNLPLVEGRRIRLTEQTWLDHISKHPETDNRLHDVEYALRSPHYVADSMLGPGGKNSGALCFVRRDASPKGVPSKVTNRSSYLHVMVKGDDNGPFVATALFSDSYHGEIRWHSDKTYEKNEDKSESLSADYDRDSDVLYFYLGSPVEAYSEGGQDGLILRYAVSDEKPCGVTVLSFSDWNDYREHLDTHVSAFLQVPPHAALDLLREF